MSGHTRNTPIFLNYACWWLSLVWLGAGASGGRASGAGVSRWPVGFWLFPFPFSRAPTRGPERGSWHQGRNAGLSVGAPAWSRTLFEMGLKFHVDSDSRRCRSSRRGHLHTVRATFRPNVVEIVIYKFDFESTNLNFKILTCF